MRPTTPTPTRRLPLYLPAEPSVYIRTANKTFRDDAASAYQVYIRRCIAARTYFARIGIPGKLLLHVHIDINISNYFGEDVASPLVPAQSYKYPTPRMIPGTDHGLRMHDLELSTQA